MLFNDKSLGRKQLKCKFLTENISVHYKYQFLCICLNTHFIHTYIKYFQYLVKARVLKVPSNHTKTLPKDKNTEQQENNEAI